MNNHEAINARLRQLEETEEQLTAERMQVLDQRRVEDRTWNLKVQARDDEEDVGPPVLCQQS